MAKAIMTSPTVCLMEVKKQDQKNEIVFLPA